MERMSTHSLRCDFSLVNMCRGCWCSAGEPFTSQWAHNWPPVNPAAANLNPWPSLQTRPGPRSHFTCGGQGLTEMGVKSFVLLPECTVPQVPFTGQSPWEIRTRWDTWAHSCSASSPSPSRFPHPQAGWQCIICWWCVSPPQRKVMSREQELDLSCSLPCSYCLVAHSNYNNMGEMIKGWINIV